MKLTPNEIHCWICRPKSIVDDGLLQRYAALLSEPESAKQRRYRFAEHRHSALVTRALIRDRLALYTGQSPEALRFVIGEKGKPWLADFPHLQFNLSHTENMVVLAVTQDTPLGVDIEWMPRRSETLAIAHRYFSTLETDALFALPADKQRDRFFDYWTLKESYIKACGLGLAIPLRHFSFMLNDEPSPIVREHIRLAFAPERHDNPDNWNSWLVNLHKDYRLALSVQAPHPSSAQLHFYCGVPLLNFDQFTPPMMSE